jgi:hypothetical protein
MVRVSFSRIYSDHFFFPGRVGLLVVFLPLFQFPVAAVWRSVSSVTKDITRLCTCMCQDFAIW